MVFLRNLTMKPVQTQLCWLALVIAGLCPTDSFGGRPLATEDAGVLENKACELEPSWTRIRATGSGMTVTGTASVVQLACGTPWRTQFSANVQRSRIEGGGFSDSATDYALGGKTGLIGDGDDALAVTLAYGFTLDKSATGSRQVTDGFVNLVVTRDLSDLNKGLTGHANLGWFGERDPKTNSTTWNLALEQALGGGFDLAAEIYGNDRGERWLGGGLRWTEGAWSLNAGAARQTKDPRATLVTAGAKLSF